MRNFRVGKDHRLTTLKDVEKLKNEDFTDFQMYPTVAFDYYKSLPKKNLEHIWKDVAPENKKNTTCQKKQTH